MNKMGKTGSIVFAALLCMTSIAAAETKCDIKAKVGKWIDKTNKQELRTMLGQYQKIQKDLTDNNGYPESVFVDVKSNAPSQKKAFADAFFAEATKFRTRLAKFASQNDNDSQEKCYICPIRRTYEQTKDIFTSCRTLMQKLDARTNDSAVIKILNENPDTRSCRNLDQLVRSDLAPEKTEDFGEEWWEDFSTKITELTKKLNLLGSGDDPLIDSNTGKTDIQTKVEQLVYLYEKFKETHRNGASNGSPRLNPDDMDKRGVCTGYFQWIRNGQ